MDQTLTETRAAEPAEGTVEETDPREQLEQRFHNGASWFYWVAGLSLVNSVIVLFGGEWGFIFGLGITQVVDAIAATVAAEAPDLTTASKLVSFGADGLIVAAVAFMGWLAHKGKQWVFVLGLALYTLDALLFLLVGDYLSLAFHGWVFFAVTSGLVACRKLAALEVPPAGQVFSPA